MSLNIVFLSPLAATFQIFRQVFILLRVILDGDVLNIIIYFGQDLLAPLRAAFFLLLEIFVIQITVLCHTRLPLSNSLVSVLWSNSILFSLSKLIILFESYSSIDYIVLAICRTESLLIGKTFLVFVSGITMMGILSNQVRIIYIKTVRETWWGIEYISMVACGKLGL